MSRRAFVKLERIFRAAYAVGAGGLGMSSGSLVIMAATSVCSFSVYFFPILGGSLLDASWYL